jgi:hypothetical protein
MFPVELQSAQAAAAFRHALSRIAMLDEQAAATLAEASNVVVEACRATDTRASQKDAARKRLHELWRTVEDCSENRRDIAESLSRRMNIFDRQVSTLLATLRRHRIDASLGSTMLPDNVKTASHKDVTVPVASTRTQADDDMRQQSQPFSSELDAAAKMLTPPRQVIDDQVDEARGHRNSANPCLTGSITSNPSLEEKTSTPTAEANRLNPPTSLHPLQSSGLVSAKNTVNKDHLAEQIACHDDEEVPACDQVVVKRSRSPNHGKLITRITTTPAAKHHQIQQRGRKAGDQENQTMSSTKNQDSVPSCRPIRIRALRPSRDKNIPNCTARTPFANHKSNRLADPRVADENTHEKIQARRNQLDSKAEKSAQCQLQRQDAEPLYCYCQRPYRESEDKMIACDGDNCPVEWFHYECVQIVLPPRGRWFCAECKSSGNVRTRRRLS